MTIQDIDWSAFLTPLQQVVLRRVHNASDADDLMQLILERAMSKAPDAQIENVARHSPLLRGHDRCARPRH